MHLKDIKKNICQCLHCGAVFEFSDRNKNNGNPYGSCPACGGTYSLIQMENIFDEFYVNKLAEKYSK